MTFHGIKVLATIPAIALGFIAAVITWKIQQFFIPKRDYYRKSVADIFSIKFFASLGTFICVSYLLYRLFVYGTIER